jgi:PAS domain S-box-containing protein
MINTWWQWISKLGLTPETTPGDERRIILTNRVSVLGGTMIIIFTSFTFSHHLMLTKVLQLGTVFLMFAVPIFNGLKLYDFAKLSLTVASCSIMFINASGMGPQSGNHLGFIPIAMTTFLAYDIRKKWLFYAGMSIPVFFFIALIGTDFSLLQVNTIPKKELDFLFLYNFIVTSIICALMGWYLVMIGNRQQYEIEKLKQTEADLRVLEEQNKYKVIFETMKDGITIMDIDGNVIDVNPSIYEIYQIPIELKATEIPLDRIITEDAAKKFQKTVDHFKKGILKNEINDTTQRRWTGEIFPVEVNSAIFYLNNHEYVLTIIKDITERNRKDNELNNLNRDLKAIVTSLDDIVLVINEYMIFENVFTSNEELLFMPKEQFLNRTIDDVFGIDHPLGAQYKKHISSTLNSGRNSAFEYPSPDGSQWFSSKIQKLHFEGNTIQKVSLIIKNITEIKQEEEKAKENYELFKLVAENVPIGLLLSRVKDGQILFANNALAKMQGRSKEEFVNVTSVNLYKNPEDRLRFIELIKEKGTVVNFESEGIHKDGTVLPALLSGTMSTYWGEPVFLGIASDISEIKKTQKELQEKTRQLAESKLTALRSQMNPHFLFNSMNSIQELILTKQSEKAYKYLTKFSRLLRDVLDNSDKLLIHVSDELNMLSLYLEIESLRFGNTFEYSIQIDPSIDLEHYKIPPLILQPFVENAIWHGLMHKDGERRLKIDITKSENGILCSILDNGIGRQKSKEIQQKNLINKTSKGLKLVDDRLQLLHDLNIQLFDSSINDHFAANGEFSGTKISFNIKEQLE